jgi:hypothetical protein
VLAYVRQAHEGDRLAAYPGLIPDPLTGEVPEIDDAPSLSQAPDLNDKPSAVLCVANLSRFAQPAELSLGRWEGCTPIELLGRVPFPRVTAKPYSVTLAPYGIYWFELVER